MMPRPLPQRFHVSVSSCPAGPTSATMARSDNVFSVHAMRRMAASFKNGVTVSITLKAVARTRLIRSIYPKRYFRGIRPAVIHELRPLMTLRHVEYNQAIHGIAGLHSGSREHAYAGGLNRSHGNSISCTF